MTGSMLRVPGTGGSAEPGCLPHRRRHLRRPHALRSQARFQAHGNREGGEGLSRPGVVCAIYFSPIAGYIPDRPVIKYLAAQRNMEIAFVPIAGTRILVPFRLKIPTPLGPAMLEATSVHHHGDAAAGGEDAVMPMRRPSFAACGRCARMRSADEKLTRGVGDGGPPRSASFAHSPREGGREK